MIDQYGELLGDKPLSNFLDKFTNPESESSRVCDEVSGQLRLAFDVIVASSGESERMRGHMASGFAIACLHGLAATLAYAVDALSEGETSLKDREEEILRRLLRVALDYTVGN